MEVYKNEIVYNKGLFGKIVITFKCGYKYSCSVNWKSPHKTVTKVKQGNVDVTEHGFPFEIDENLILKDDDTMIQFYSIEALSLYGDHSYLIFNHNYKLYKIDCPDKGYHMEYTVKNNDRYKEAASKKINSILKNSLAAFAKCIDQDGNRLSVIFVNGYLYKIF